MGFMEGYTRTDDVRRDLSVLVHLALAQNPGMRLGQLLINVASANGIDETDLWNVHDETWIQWLREWNAIPRVR